MDVLLWLVFALVVFLAYRAIRGGFERAQSIKLNVYGIIGCIVLLILVLSLFN